MEEQVKKRLFEEQMAREKAHRLKLEMDARDRAKQLQQIQLAHTKEMEQLRKKFAESRSVYLWHFLLVIGLNKFSGVFIIKCSKWKKKWVKK